ncbi:component of SufBCD complex [Pontibaca salina]|uniref:Component of SufBCD complex n=1 Tax=Pontibaca salina TaxID=2795731 RepID=A0A934M0V8_9RHOB|nr:component of SufBCD complex [Pontibaca salina]MBI6629051.1 component of SufBCD complex [Pontibaca salina]
MGFYSSIFELINMRSFSNLWFWIVLAVLWAAASHWVLGVPYDMILRAQRRGGQAETDFEDMTRINVNRLCHVVGVAGVWLLGGACFLLSALAMLGFVYRIEFAQALFLLGFPLFFVALLSLTAARRIASEAPQGEELRRYLLRQRVYIQMIGAVAIFVTALWGMYQNLSIGVLGY